MTKICLVRHGETVWNILGKLQGLEDIELNEKGEREALSVSKYLADQYNSNWDVLLSSPLKRAKKTAEIINNNIKIESIIENNNLIERDYGKSSGLTKEEIKIKFPDDNIPGIESRADVRKRVVKVLDEVTREYPGKNVIIVAHGAVINSILAFVSNEEIGSGKTVLKTACVSILNYENEKWDIEMYNQVVSE